MADTMNFGPEWLRTLSSGSGSSNTGGGSNTGPLSPTKLPHSSSSLKKLHFKMAEHRYGKEELLQLFNEDPMKPSRMPFISPITRTQALTPLAFMPHSEEEQVAMTGGVNSGSVYGMRGGRGFYSRGRGGRGRGGRMDYHRSSSYSDEHDRSGGFPYYGRGGGAAGGGEPWAPDATGGNRGTSTGASGGGGGGAGGSGSGGGAYTPTGPPGGPGSRASRDGNWRSPSTPQTDETPTTPDWGSHWHPPPSPAGKQPPRAWRDKELQKTDQQPQKWNSPLPEWASDDSVTSTTVGSFDSSGNFTASTEKDKVKVQDIRPPDPGDSKPPSEVATKSQLLTQQQKQNSKPQQPPPSAPAAASLPKIPEQHERPANVELDPVKQQLKRTVSGPARPANLDSKQQGQPLTGSATPGPTNQDGVQGTAVQAAASVTTPSSNSGGQPLNLQLHGSGSLGIQPPNQGGVTISPGVVAMQGGGGGLLTTATPTSMLSNSLGNSVGLPSGQVMSHDPTDDSVFSPGIDERMKLLERATEALLSTEEEDTPTPSPTVTSAAIPVSPGGAIRPSSIHPQTVVAQRSAPQPPLASAAAPVNYSTTSQPQPASVVPPQATVQQQAVQAAMTPTTPSLPPVNVEDMHKWLYKDPQGEIQGPFSSDEMKQWFDAGYFTMDLMVCRRCDTIMLPLGDVIRIWGRMPFVMTGQHPPPIRAGEPFWQKFFQTHQLMLQQQQLLFQQQQAQGQSSAQTPATSQVSTVQQPLKQEVLQVEATPTPSSTVSGGATPQATPTPTTTAGGSIWGRKTVNEDDNVKMEQWPDITSSESPWKTATSSAPTSSQQARQPLPAVSTQQPAAAVVAATSPSESTMEQLRQEQARRMATITSERAAAAAVAEEERKAKEKEEKQRQQQQQQQQQREMEERKLKQEEERKRIEEERQRKLMEEARQREAEKKRQAELLEQQRKREEELRRQREEKARLQQQQIQQAQELERQRKLEEEKRLQVEREQQQQRLRQQQQQQSQGAWSQVGGATTTSGSSGAGGGVAPAGRGRGGGVAGGTASVGSGGRPALSLLQIQEQEAAEQRQYEDSLKAQQQQARQMQQMANQAGWGKSGQQKPKSFLEIQQEQESDFSIKGTVPVHTTGGGGVTTPTSNKSFAPSSKGSSWSSVAKSKQSQQQPPPWSHPSTAGVQQTTPTSQRGRVPSFTADNDDDDEAAFWDECDKAAKKNPAPQRARTQQKKTVDKGEQENLRRLLSANDASSDFNSWCKKELQKFNTDVDTATFVSFLLEVESIYEVHDYVKSYLGETNEAHDFAKQFLERRQKLKPPSSQQPQSRKSRTRDRTLSSSGEQNSSSSSASGRPDSSDHYPSGGGGVGGGASTSGNTGTAASAAGSGGGSKASKKKKKKMQKVNPAAMLGFTVNAAERPNMGEIQSIQDTR